MAEIRKNQSGASPYDPFSVFSLFKPTYLVSIMEVSLDALAQVADYFKVLSEVSRLQVLCCLKSGSKNVSEIMAATDLGQANVSKHLKILTQAGILSRKPSGVSVYYEIADPIIFKLCELACDRRSISLTKSLSSFMEVNSK